ncbi:MAG: VOC family protein [Candidatus Hodarchaeales archaeon]
MQFGKFAWILDPDGNEIEFWEPNKDFFLLNFNDNTI